MRLLGDRAAVGEIAARAGCTLPVTSILLLEHLEDAGPRRVSQIAACQNVGMPAVTPRLKDLERENSTLKRLLADAELEKAALKEIARGNF